MGMRVNKQLPLPLELKEEYPLSKDIVELKDGEIKKFEIFLPENPINLSYSWDLVQQIMKWQFVIM